MLLTLHVTKGLAFILCFGLALETPVLDLRKLPTHGAVSMGVPGGAIGGTTGASSEQKFRIPLTVRIVSVQPQIVRPTQPFAVEVEIRNTGTTAFQIPASTVPTRAHRPGNKGRRTLLFNLKFASANGEVTSSIAASSFGSITDGKSLIPLGPQQSLRIIFEGNTPTIPAATSAHILQMSVELKEWLLDDNKYFVATRSELIPSTNKVGLQIAAKQ